MSKEKTTNIKFTIKLNENNIPTDIQWIASDTSNHEAKRCKSFMINLWDREEKQTLSLNLWTGEMQVDEMYVHFYQSLIEMAGSLQRATGNTFAVEDMRKFCDDFDKKVRLKMGKEK